MLDNKDKLIKNEIDNTPGIELYQISKNTKINKSTVAYRLKELERLELVRLERGHVRLYCYPVAHTVKATIVSNAPEGVTNE